MLTILLRQATRCFDYCKTILNTRFVIRNELGQSLTGRNPTRIEACTSVAPTGRSGSPQKSAQTPCGSLGARANESAMLFKCYR
jgi:hypothetical protein